VTFAPGEKFRKRHARGKGSRLLRRQKANFGERARAVVQALIMRRIVTILDVLTRSWTGDTSRMRHIYATKAVHSSKVCAQYQTRSAARLGLQVVLI